MSDAAQPDEPVPSARALLKERDYVMFWGTRWTGSFASQIQSVAMGWQMYAIARQTKSVEESAFLVGMIGNRGGQPNIVAIPISKFRKFWDEVQAGKYKWHKKGAEGTGAASSRGVSADKLSENIKLRWSGELKLTETSK